MNLSRLLLHLITSRSSMTWLSVSSKKTKLTFATKLLKKWRNTEMQWRTLLIEREVLRRILSYLKWWDKEDLKKVNAALELKWICNTLIQTWEISSLSESDSLATHTPVTSGAFIQLTIILIVSLIVLRTSLILFVHLNSKSEEKVIISFLLILIFTNLMFGSIQDSTFLTLSCPKERSKLLLKKVSYKAGMIQDFLL